MEKRPFRSLEDLVDYYSCRGRGLVCPLSRPIAQTNEDEEPPDSGDMSCDYMRHDAIIMQYGGDFL